MLGRIDFSVQTKSEVSGSSCDHLVWEVAHTSFLSCVPKKTVGMSLDDSSLLSVIETSEMDSVPRGVPQPGSQRVTDRMHLYLSIISHILTPRRMPFVIAR